MTMPHVTGSISLRHADHIPLPLDEIRQRITDIEERANLPRLHLAAVSRHVDRRCNIVRAKALGIIPRDA